MARGKTHRAGKKAAAAARERLRTAGHLFGGEGPADLPETATTIESGDEESSEDEVKQQLLKEAEEYEKEVAAEEEKKKRGNMAEGKGKGKEVVEQAASLGRDAAPRPVPVKKGGLMGSRWATEPNTPAGGVKPASHRNGAFKTAEVKKEVRQSQPARDKLVATKSPAAAPRATASAAPNSPAAGPSSPYIPDGKPHLQTLTSVKEDAPDEVVRAAAADIIGRLDFVGITAGEVMRRDHMTAINKLKSEHAMDISDLKDTIKEAKKANNFFKAQVHELQENAKNNPQQEDLQKKLNKALEDLEQETSKAKLDREARDDFEQQLIRAYTEHQAESEAATNFITELRAKNDQLMNENAYRKQEVDAPETGLYAQIQEKDTEITRLQELVKDVKVLEMVRAVNEEYQQQIAHRDNVIAELNKSLSESQQASQQATITLQQKLQDAAEVEAKLNDTEAAKTEVEQKMQAIRERTTQVYENIAEDLAVLGYNLNSSIVVEKPVKTATLAEELRFNDDASDSGESDVEHASNRHSHTPSAQEIVRPFMVDSGSQTDAITPQTFTDILPAPITEVKSEEKQELSLSKISNVFDIEPVVAIKQEEKLSFSPIINIDTAPISPPQIHRAKMVSSSTQYEQTPLVSSGTQYEQTPMVSSSTQYEPKRMVSSSTQYEPTPMFSTGTQVDRVPMKSASTQIDQAPMKSASTQVDTPPMISASTQTAAEKKEQALVEHKGIQTDNYTKIASVESKGVQTENKEVKVDEKSAQTGSAKINVAAKGVQTENQTKPQYKDSQTDTCEIKINDAAEDTVMIDETASLTFRQMVTSPSLAHAYLTTSVAKIPSYMQIILALAFLLAGMLCSAALSERTLWSIANDPSLIRDHLDTAFPRFVSVPIFGESLAQMLCDWMGIDTTPLV